MMRSAAVTEYAIQIDDRKMKACPLCGGTKIGGPGHKPATDTTPKALTYTCSRCKYTQYVHTGDNMFLKSVMIEPI